MENDANEMNKTLIPNSDGEEDMAIDCEEGLSLESASIPKEARVHDLDQLFQDVWYIIYKYTCRYAFTLGIELGVTLPCPKEEELPPYLHPKENGKHLNQLTHGVVQLAKYLNE